MTVVLFDLDDTLFDHAAAVRSGVAAHRRTVGLDGDEAEEFARWHALEEKHYHRYLAGELTFLDQRRERVRGFVEPFPVDLRDDDHADEWFGAYLLEYEKAWTLHADTLPCLDELRDRGMRLGIITNAERAFQLRKLDALALTARMEHIVASGDLGFAKPDARIFAHAIELFGVPAAEAVYVGDRLETDALGAARAGLTGVWIDRHGVASVEELARAAEAGVRVIRSLAELPPLLG